MFYSKKKKIEIDAPSESKIDLNETYESESNYSNRSIDPLGGS
jgi:hypothetical protein